MQLRNFDQIIESGSCGCYFLENADGKSWILPKKHLRTALELYQPSGRKGKLLKRLLPYLHLFPFVRKVIHARPLSIGLADEIRSRAESAFQVEHVEFSIFGGTPSVHRKVTIQFFSGGKILGYGKVTASEEIAALFRHEEGLLRNLKNAGIEGIPECLYCGTLASGMYLFIQTTSKTVRSSSPGGWSALHEDFLRQFYEKTRREERFEDTDFAHSLFALREHLSYVPEEFRQTIGTELDAVVDLRRGKRVEYAAFHADFTPWNMYVESGRLQVFDWEYGRMSYPPMLDRYHFVVQQALHVDRLRADETLERLKRNEWFDAVDLKCYLLDMVSRFTLRENGRVSDELYASLKFWIQLIDENRMLPFV